MKNAKNIRVPVYFISDFTPPKTLSETEFINEQFNSKTEFEVHLSYLNTSNRDYYSYGEFQKLVSIVKAAKSNDDQIIIIARSSHTFTKNYSFSTLLKQIHLANQFGAKILYGSASGHQDAIYIKNNLFFINEVGKTSFFILYRDSFDLILNFSYHTDSFSNIDKTLTNLTSNKFLLYPFISDSEDFVQSKEYLETHHKLKEIKDRTTTYRKKISFVSKNESFKPANISKNGSLKAPLLYDLAERELFSKVPEQKIIVLVPLYNVGFFIDECINSLVTQCYINYEIVILDDCSDDNAVERLPSEYAALKILKSSTRRYAMANLFHGLKSIDCSDEAIILIVDGDDYLYHNYVFKMINFFYEKKKCLLSYGQYYTTSNHMGHCTSYTHEEFSKLRQLDWRASHLKTFKYKLFKELVLQDPQVIAFKDEKGSFFEMTSDVALMHPLMEIAGHENCYFVEDVSYIYRHHPQNDSNRNIELQRSTEDVIKKKAPFKRVF